VGAQQQQLYPQGQFSQYSKWICPPKLKKLIQITAQKQALRCRRDQRAACLNPYRRCGAQDERAQHQVEVGLSVSIVPGTQHQ